MFRLTSGKCRRLLTQCYWNRFHAQITFQIELYGIEQHLKETNSLLRGPIQSDDRLVRQTRVTCSVNLCNSAHICIDHP